MRILNRVNFNSILNLYTILSVPLLFIPIFVNFDSHHDGLILTTTLELRKAIESGGDWPFNQYGQLWAFPLAFISFLVADEYLLVAIRMVTFTYYLLTALFIHKISPRFLTGNHAKIPTLLFLLAQPFSLGLNSTFLPWPSALCTLLVTIALERLTSTFRFRRNSDCTHFFVGGLVVAILGTRLQVGLLLLLAIPVLLFCHRKAREACAVLVGFFFWLVLVQTLMHSQGWLIDSLFDSIVFSSQYISGGTPSYPVPKVTLILSAFFLVGLFVIAYLAKLRNFSFRYKILPLLLISSILASSVIATSLLSEQDFLTWLTLLFRRVWISASISLLIYSLILLVIPLLKRRNIFGDSKFSQNLLLIFSVCSFTQIAPLFDQMHFWWGFSPFVILATVNAREIILENLSLQNLARPISVIAGTVLLCMNIFGVGMQLSSAQTFTKPTIASGVLTVDTSDNKIANFLNANIDADSSVLNLCPNSNVFFSVKSTNSAIREFVLWSPTFEFSEYRKDFLHAKFDYMVTCPMKDAMDIGQIKINSSIEEIVKRWQLRTAGTYSDPHGRQWSIYLANE